MTGAQVAATAAIAAVVGVFVAGFGGATHNAYLLGVGATDLLFALVLAVLSLRDR